MNPLWKCCSIIRLSAVAGICAAGVLFASAAPPGSEIKKPTNKTPAAASTANIDPARIQLPTGKPIPFQEFSLKELQAMWHNDKLTLDSEVTLGAKKPPTGPLPTKNDSTLNQPTKSKTMKLSEYKKQLDGIEQKLNEHGKTLRRWNGPVKMTLSSKGTPQQFAKQRAAIAKDHHAAPGKSADVFAAAKPTKDSLAADKKTYAAFEKARKEAVAEAIKKIDPAKLNAEQKKTYDALKSGKPMTAESIHASNLILQHLGDLRSLFAPTATDYHKSWTWSAGSADVAEVDIVGTLDLTTSVSLAGGIDSMHAHGSLEADAFILDDSRTSPHKVVEILADFSSSHSGQTLQASAKILGQDLFDPINKTVKNGDLVNIDKDLPFDKTITEGVTEILGIPITYQVKGKGDFHYTIVGTATAAGLSVNPSAKLSSSLVATAEVPAAAIVEVGVRGNVNLVSDTLNLSGSIGIGQSGGGPFLDTKAQAQDTVKLLGGEIDFVVTLDLGITSVDLASVKLFSLPEFDSSGFIFGPDELKKPLQQQANPGPVADTKKK